MNRAAHAEARRARCADCNGFGIDPQIVPARLCRTCGGSGRAAPAAQQKGLIDG